MSVALITGVTGQDGSYLAEKLLQDGYEVVGTCRHDGPVARPDYFMPIAGRVELVPLDLLAEDEMVRLIERYRPAEIYNLAARASSRQLFADPVLTGNINGLAVGRWLEVIRRTDPRIRFCQASSSEMYGMPAAAPQNESTPFRPRNPYGAAKLYAHWLITNYRDAYGLFACSAILFNHESPRRGLELVTRRITDGVARISLGLRPDLTLGSLEAQRDWGFAGDYANAMRLMLRQPEADDYVVATGELHSVRELCELAFTHAGLDYRNHVRLDPQHARPKEMLPLVGDAAKATVRLGWKPTIGFGSLVGMMVDADIERLQQALREKGS